jgi:hypothetical protein
MKHLALEIYAEMLEFFEDPAESTSWYVLPVSAIDGVGCRAVLKFHRDGLSVLELSPVHMHSFEDGDDIQPFVYFIKHFEKPGGFRGYTAGHVQKILLQAQKTMAALQFNRLSGRFQPRTPGTRDLKAFGCENVQTDLRECRVCGETTRTKTNCDCSAQYLCFACWDRVQPVREERFGEAFKVQRCPECSAELIYSAHRQR